MELLKPISSYARSLRLQYRLRQSLAGKHDHLVKRHEDCLPNFIVIGAAKSATTSLAKVLMKHPDIHFSSAKEPKFFGRNYHKGWDWYAHFFEAGRHQLLRGEASTMYSSSSHEFQFTPQLIHHHLGVIKLIYLVRHPMKRIVSHWRHYRGKHPECPEFQEILRNHSMRKRIVDTSLYHQQLKRYLNVFPANMIHCMMYEDLINRPKKTLSQMFAFLGVKSRLGKILKQGRIPTRNVAGSKGRELIGVPEWSPQLKSELLDIVRPDAELMLQHMGRPLDSWDWSL